MLIRHHRPALHPHSSHTVCTQTHGSNVAQILTLLYVLLQKMSNSSKDSSDADLYEIMCSAGTVSGAGGKRREDEGRSGDENVLFQCVIKAGCCSFSTPTLMAAPCRAASD